MRSTILGLCIALVVAGCREKQEQHAEGEHAEGEHAEGEHAEGEHAEGEHAEGETSVRVSPAAIERSGIEIAAVKEETLTGGIDLPAEVRAEPDRTAHISPLLSGQLASVKASVGERVEEGSVLATLRSVELGASRSALARARANVEVARSNFERQKELQREGIGARRNYLEAQAELRRAEAELTAAQRALEVYGRGGSGSTVPLRSPIAGQVVERHATVGEVVGPEDVLFQVTDIGRVWVVGRAYQQHAGAIRAGAPAIVTLQAYPGRSWEGVVDYVAPTLDEDTRTLPVRVVFDNPDGLLRPGMFGTLSISPAGTASEAVPVIQRAAVQTIEGQTVVFVPGEEEGEFHATPVSLGNESGGRVRVLRGLSPGDRYVTRGGFVLKSELMRGELGEGHAH